MTRTTSSLDDGRGFAPQHARQRDQEPDPPRIGYGLVSLGGLLAAVVLTGSPHERRLADAARPHAAAPDLGCAVDASPEGGLRLRLVNQTAAPIPAGTRWAWSSSGTPRPVGEVRVLTRPLAPGASEVVRSDQPPRGHGCVARLLQDDDLARPGEDAFFRP